MKRRKITLETQLCKRGCGNQITSLSRPIFSSGQAYQDLSGICARCWTKQDAEALDADYRQNLPRLISQGAFSR